MNSKVTETGDGPIFEVFARFRASEPMRHIGSVVAQDAEAAKLHAFTLYNEWDWSRMFVAQRRDIVSLVDPVKRKEPSQPQATVPGDAEIYGRKVFTEPLARVESPAAGQNGWVELVAIPQSAMTLVVGEEAAP